VRASRFFISGFISGIAYKLGAGSKDMAEDGERSAIYKIRWEILVMAISLILIVVVVYAIPNDFSLKMLEQREKQRALEQASRGQQSNGTSSSIGGSSIP
jgi:hypothetical protein